jgi:putative oxidoreductase
MSNPLDRYSEHLFAALRIVAGLLFACHGAQKMFGVFGGHLAATPLLHVAGVIELLGGVLIALGLFAAPAAFLASGEMAVAYFKSHAPVGFLPIVNHGEQAVVYCFLFLYIAARGSGRFSLGRLLGRSRGPDVTAGPARG